MNRPRAPRDLGKRGRSFWTAVLAEHDLDADTGLVLVEICRLLDEIDLLKAAVERDGATTTGSAGQTVEHPCLAGLRAHRALLEKLIVRLGLPAEDGSTPATVAQLRSRTGNDARWGGHRVDEARRAEMEARWDRGSA